MLPTPLVGQLFGEFAVLGQQTRQLAVQGVLPALLRRPLVAHLREVGLQRGLRSRHFGELGDMKTQLVKFQGGLLRLFGEGCPRPHTSQILPARQLKSTASTSTPLRQTTHTLFIPPFPSK